MGMDVLSAPAVDLAISRLHQHTGEVLRSVRLEGTEYLIRDRWGDPVARILPVAAET